MEALTEGAATFHGYLSKGGTLYHSVPLFYAMHGLDGLMVFWSAVTIDITAFEGKTIHKTPMVLFG